MDYRKKIEYGDRIFARLTMKGRTVVEFMINQVADMTQLIGELRHLTYGVYGLASLYIRNQTKGWSEERPLMLYSPERPSNPLFTPSGHVAATPSYSPFSVSPAPHMAFPWETH